MSEFSLAIPADSQWQEQLSEDGYCVLPRVIGAAALADLRERFNSTTLAQAPEDNFGEAGAFIGSDYLDPVSVDLLAGPGGLPVLRRLGYAEPKLHSYYVSTKPPGAAALPWHSDLFYEYSETKPSELFLIHSLDDTSRENGCLRVVPGSHLWSRDDRRARSNLTRLHPDEADVPLHAGDLFVGDRRILHATHANASELWRTCITIACAPDFASLSEPIQSRIVENRCLPPRGWWSENGHGIDVRLQAILPVYSGAAEPAELIY